MADTDSNLSTDSDENSAIPFLQHFLGYYPDDYYLERNIEVEQIGMYEASTDDSSASDSFSDLYHDSTSIAVSFQNLSLIYFILI